MQIPVYKHGDPLPEDMVFTNDGLKIVCEDWSKEV